MGTWRSKGNLAWESVEAQAVTLDGLTLYAAEKPYSRPQMGGRTLYIHRLVG